MKIYGAIFARGGSKGIINKNLQTIKGESLTKRALRDLEACRDIESIYLSSDSMKILEESNSFRGISNIRRPDLLAADNSNELDAWKHLIQAINANDEDILVVAPTTSPMRKVQTLNEMIKIKVKSSDCDGVVCICTASRHPQFNLLKKNGPNGYLKLWDDNKTTDFIRAKRRQETTGAYDLTTVAFVYNIGYLKRCGHILDGRIMGVVVDKIEGLDIDTQEELNYARYLIEEKDYELR